MQRMMHRFPKQGDREPWVNPQNYGRDKKMIRFGEDYIKSQKHQGWTLVPAGYDDGGYSGGSTERPGLQKLLEERKITLTLDGAARDWLADKGWDPAYGARPLKRVIQRNLQDPLAEMILAGDVADGDRVAISEQGNVLTFNGKAPQSAEIETFEAPTLKRKLH